MNTQNQSQYPNIIEDSKKIIRGLLFTASLSSSKAETLLLLNAARKIAQLEKNAIASSLTTGATGAKQITDRQNLLLQHCLGSYDPEEAEGCEHFPNGDYPSVPEAASLLILLQTGDFSAVPNSAKFNTFLQHPDSTDLLAVSEAGDAQYGQDEPEQRPTSISAAQFFNAVNGKVPEPLSGPVETPEDAKNVMLRSISQDVDVNGAFPSDGDARLDRGVNVGAKFLANVLAQLPPDVDPTRVLDDMRYEHAHLGEHIENGDIPEGQVEKVAGFHNFLGRILDAASSPTA